MAGVAEHVARSPAICRDQRRLAVCSRASGIPVVLSGDGGESFARWFAEDGLAVSGGVVAVKMRPE
mgnify:CR=1 FL=1